MPLFFFKSGSWIRKCLVLCSAFIIAASVFLYFFSPKLLHSEYIKAQIGSLILEKTGHKVQFADFAINILPVPSIAFHELSLNINDSLKTETKKLKIFFNPEAALKGKIQPDKIDIFRPLIYSRKKKPAYIPDLISWINKTPQLLKTILQFLPDTQNTVKLTVHNAESRYSGSINSTIVLSKKNQRLSVKTDIADIKFNSSEFFPSELKKFIRLGETGIKKAVFSAVIGSDNRFKARVILHKAKFMSTSGSLIMDCDRIETKLKFSDHKLKIDTEKFTMNYPKAQLSIHFSAEIQHSELKNPELKFAGTNINIAQAGRMSAQLFAGDQISSTIFSILKSGFAPYVAVLFHSIVPENLFHEKNLELRGKLENGRVDIPGTSLSTEHVYGNAQISRGVLTINAAKASLKNSTLENGRLAVNLADYPDFPFYGSFSINTDLSQLPQILTGLFDDESALTKELSLVHDIRGKAEIKLDLRLETGADIPIIKIRADKCKISGNYDRIPGKINLEHLRFTYSPALVTLSGLTGSINKTMFRDMNISIGLKEPYTIAVDSGTGRIDIGTTIAWIRQSDRTRKKILPLRSGTGTIMLDSMKLNGPVSAPELWKFEFSGTGNDISLSATQYHDQIKNMSCRFHFTNHLIFLNEIHGTISDISWLYPMVRRKNLDSFALPVTIEKGNFRSDNRGSFFRACLKFAKGPELFMDMKGRKITDLAPVTLKISDSGFSDAYLSFNHETDKPKFSFTGVVDTRTIDKMLVKGSFWARQLNELTENQPVVIKKINDKNLDISIRHINLEPVLLKSSEFGVDLKNMPFKRIDLKADEIGIKKWTVTNADTTLSLRGNDSYIRIKKASLCDLGCSGYLNLKGRKVSATIKFSAADKPDIQKLLTCLFNDQHLMDGRYSLDLDIRTSADQDKIPESINGSLKLEAEKGRIYKLTLLSRILSLLNISKIFRGKLPNLTQHGFAYENFSVDADIKNSRILLKKAVIDGNDMTLVFSGWIDPLKDDMNIICLISPFKTIDLIIENIPVVNTLLGGRLISIPVKATGKLSDPDVMPLHPSAVGEGLINMMGTILKTPVKLWDKINGKK